jgi:NAD-dependent SIR2 family protein deacetylase
MENVAACIAQARHLLITAGAGIGVDSGLPDFRGNEGFWNAYPPYRRLGVGFTGMANPRNFATDPRFGWGFYAHRQNLYRATVPHEGFSILRRWVGAKQSAFVLTSNVDGQFQKAGFDAEQLYEIHGSIHHLQCVEPCQDEVWSADALSLEIDEATMTATGELPRCPRCGALARPNVLMFGDFGYTGARQADQRRAFDRWLTEAANDTIVIVELGAGTAVPSIRIEGERLHRGLASATLLRINPREPEAPAGAFSISDGALAALQALDGMVSASPSSFMC